MTKKILLSVFMLVALFGDVFAWLPLPIRSPSLDAPLLSTLVPIRAVDGTPTFTRATVRMCQDQEGKWRNLPSGAACFTGARMVWNLISTKSEDFSNAAWTKAGSMSVTGTNTLNFPAENDQIMNNTARATANRSYRGRIVLSGSGTISIRITGFNFEQFTTITLTSIPTTYATGVFTEGAGGTGSFGFGIKRRAGETATTVTANYAMAEDVTGLSNQNPSEYVSVGVLSAPFHGAGVDGIRFYEYENGNTVASNVVTEAQGAAISSSTLKGYLAEGARTNSVFQSRNFDTTWADTNCAGAAGSCEAKNATGIDGVSNTAWTLTDDNAAAHTSWYANSVTIANDNAVHVCSGNVQKDTDVTRFAAINCSLTIGTTQTQLCHLNTQTGAVVEEIDTGSNDTCTATLTPDGLWWLLQMTATNNTSGNTSLTMYLYPARATVIGTANAAATGSAIFDQAQVELNSTFASSPIVTTTAAVSRASDVLSYPASNYDATKGTALARVSSIWGTNTNAAGTPVAVLGISASGRPIYAGYAASSNIFKFYDGTTAFDSNTSTSFRNNPLRMASSWGAVGMSAVFNNTTVTTSAFDGSLPNTALYIGSWGDVVSTWFGNISGVKLWKYKVPDSYLKRITQ